jgi:DNA-binding NtrC family response regulator
MAFGIIKQSGGHIDVDSNVGVGSTFTIYLPQVEAGQALRASHRLDAAPLRRGNETVLLVEDEVLVGRLARTALEQSGYEVLFASNGREALNVADAHLGTIDLLVSDVVMPEMHGPDLAQQLCQRRPGLKVLFISGYIHDGGERLGMSASPFLAKPFTLNQLSDKVRAVLDGEA